MVLVTVIAGGRFLSFMGDAAQGRILAEVVLTILLYKLPNLIMLILPLGYFLGIIVSHGRLYVEHEMSVLRACGVGPIDLLRFTVKPMVVTFIITAILSIWLCPLVAKRTEVLLDEQYNRSEFETLTPGRFHSTKDMHRATYAKKLSDQKTNMEDLFIAEEQQDNVAVIVAEKGVRKVDAQTGAQYLELDNGRRYDGYPGQNDYRVIEFEHYRMQMAPPEKSKTLSNIQNLKITELVILLKSQSKSLFAKAELQWRLSLPFIIPILTFIAIPLAKVNPRQGRFLKLFPAIFLYLFYLTLLINGKNAIEKEKWPLFSMWLIHTFFLIGGFFLYFLPQKNSLLSWIKKSLRSRK